MAKNSSGAFCPPLHNISRQSAAVCRYGHARLCVMTRGVRAGETFSKVSPRTPFQNFLNRGKGIPVIGNKIAMYYSEQGANAPFKAFIPMSIFKEQGRWLGADQEFRK